MQRRDKVKVLITEDSAAEALLLQEIFLRYEDIEVVGVAKNGNEAVKLTHALQPDIITMDICMPELDGLQATQIIMQEKPTPIVILSSYVDNEKLQIPFKALEYGALTVMQKPHAISKAGYDGIEDELIETIRAMAEIKVVVHRNKYISLPTDKNQHVKSRTSQSYSIIGLGCSIGGPLALQTILAPLPSSYAVPIIVVQHMFRAYYAALIDWLQKKTSLTVKLVQSGEHLSGGTVLICPSNQHFIIQKDKDTGCLIALLNKKSKKNGFRPSIDILFESMAEVAGCASIGGLLTGMGNDGVEGLRKIKLAGGHTFVQDPLSCVVPTMSQAALKIDAADMTVDLKNIAFHLEHIIQ